MLAVAADAVAGLSAVHDMGGPHRAVSPQALLRGEDGRVRLATPALPVLAELAAAEEGTGHEPPEVLAGNDWTPAGDVYALASSLWTLLTGKTADMRERLERARAGTPPVMPRTDVPEAIASALTDAMAADPIARPASAAELLATLTGPTIPHSGADTLPPDTMPPNAPVPLDGRSLGSGYQLVERIGQGSSGKVFRARRRPDGAEFAAKFLDPALVDDRTAVSRFFAERDALERVDHPNLLKVHDLVVERRQIAIVMDLVDGPDLRQLIGSGSLTRADAVRLLGQVAAALAAMHAADVIHRDVKPGNVVVDESGPARIARLVDFGLAKMSGQPTITRQHALLGTLAYVAPELAASHPATTASDVYALGVTGYELLAGRRPFHADNEFALLQAHLTQAPARPNEVTDEEWALLSACLAKDPAARPTAGQVADELATLAVAVPTTPPVGDEPTTTTMSFELVTEHAPLPGSDPDTEDRGSSPTDGGVLQSTMDGWWARAPAAPELVAPRRRPPLPIMIAAAATAVVGTTIGVLLATQTSDDYGEPPAAPIPVHAEYGDDGKVLLDWSDDVERRPGFQSYQILRDNKPLDELPAGETSYQDAEPGSSPCYTVLALGVSESDSPPSAGTACPNRKESS
jgi:serine/threonine-protein kinase